MSRTAVDASTTIPGVTPAEVFAHLVDPTNHVRRNTDHPDVVEPTGADRLTGTGDTFGMRMRWGPMTYRVTNTVVEFEPDRRIAWRHFPGHRWRYDLAPTDDGTGTVVTESFDMSEQPRPLQLVMYRWMYGFPDAYEANLRESLDDLRTHLTASSE